MSNVDKPSWWRSASPLLNWPTAGGKRGGRVALPEHLSRRGTVGFKNISFMSLSELQQRVASLVFSLAEADGFALAGGGALIAHEVVDRTTRDLDCFGPTREAVDRLWPATSSSPCSAEPHRGTSSTCMHCATTSPGARSSRSQPRRISASTLLCCAVLCGATRSTRSATRSAAHSAAHSCAHSAVHIRLCTFGVLDNLLTIL